MMQQQTTAVELPADLNSPRAKLVYLYLSTHGAATIGDLQQHLSMRKLTLYSILKTLRERDIVQQESDRYVIG